MSSATETAVRFGFNAGRAAGWQEAIAAATASLVRQGQPIEIIAAMIRDTRTPSYELRNV